MVKAYEKGLTLAVFYRKLRGAPFKQGIGIFTDVEWLSIIIIEQCGVHRTEQPAG